MTRTMTRLGLKRLLLVAAFALAACRQEAAQDVAPVDFTTATIGHYCQMNLSEHPGPKAQVHLDGVPGGPLFFSQVRDAIAYLREPEQVAPVLAVYVNDMGRTGASWDDPGAGNWLDADAAVFVVGSAREGGMGAPETVPFADPAAAARFAAAEGGRVLTLDQITGDMVLAPVEGAGAAHGPSPDAAADDADFEQRLRALPRGGQEGRS